MGEAAAIYFEDHKEFERPRASGFARRHCLSSRCNTVTGSPVSRCGCLGTALGAGGFWISCDCYGSDELCAIVDRFWPRRRYSTKKQDNSKPGQQSFLAQQRNWVGGCGGCGCMQPADCMGISRTQARGYRTVFGDHLRAARISKPAPSALTPNNAICHNCQDTVSRHFGRNCNRRHFRNSRLWLLGACAATHCELSLHCCRSVALVPMETRLSGP